MHRGRVNSRLFGLPARVPRLASISIDKVKSHLRHAGLGHLSAVIRGRHKGLVKRGV